MLQLKIASLITATKEGLASPSVQLWDALRHRGLAVARRTAHQHSTPGQKEHGSLQVTLDCMKKGLITASKAKQTNTMETAVKGKKYHSGEYLWGKSVQRNKDCISLSFTACEKLQYNATPQNLPRKPQQ